MFIFIKKIFYIGSLCFSSLVSATPLNAIPLSCISLKNQKCRVRPKIAGINSNNPIFYPFSIKIVVVAVITSIINMQKVLFLIL